MTGAAYVVTIDSPGLAADRRRFATQTLQDATSEVGYRIGDRPVPTSDDYGDPHVTLSSYLYDRDPLETAPDGETVALPDGSTVTVTLVTAPEDWYANHDNVIGLASWLIEQDTFTPGANTSHEEALRNLNAFHEKPYHWAAEYALWVATGQAEGTEDGPA